MHMTRHITWLVGLTVMMMLFAAVADGAERDSRRRRQRRGERSNRNDRFAKQGVAVGKTLPGSIPIVKLNAEQGDLAKAWKDRPVLLVTGSLTCPVSRRQYENAHDIAAKFKNDIYVIQVYTLEAHPKDSESPYRPGKEWTSRRNTRQGITAGQPSTLQDRLALANEFKKQVDVGVTIAVDNMDNKVWKMLGGGPNVGVLVDKGGEVVAKHGWFDGPTMTQSIEHLLGKAPRAPTTQPAASNPAS